MTSKRNSDDLISELAGTLAPVHPMLARRGAMLVALAAVLTAIAVLTVNGLAGNVGDGSMSAPFLIGNGLLVLLGLAATGSALAQASPRVGNRHDGMRWVIAMACVFPGATLLLLLPQYEVMPQLLSAGASWHCFAESVLASLLVGTALLVWLRRGAPASPDLAGLHLGIAASALGTAIYGLTCEADTLYHLGVWHALPVVLGGLAGRIAIPPLLRW